MEDEKLIEEDVITSEEAEEELPLLAPEDEDEKEKE